MKVTGGDLLFQKGWGGAESKVLNILCYQRLFSSIGWELSSLFQTAQSLVKPVETQAVSILLEPRPPTLLEYTPGYPGPSTREIGLSRRQGIVSLLPTN